MLLGICPILIDVLPLYYDTFGHARKCQIIGMSYSWWYDILASNVILSRFSRTLPISI